MHGATFDELFEKSKAFRKLFIGEDQNFQTMDDFDREKAKALWEKRYPKVDWDFCQHDRCHKLVEHGAYCGRHCENNNSLPEWQWVGTELYRYMCLNYNAKAGYRKNKWEYRDYLKHQAKRRFGSIPDGYEVLQIDGNFFNFHRTNIVLLSKVSVAAVKAGVIDINSAFEMDEILVDFFAEKFRAGMKPFGAIFSYGDIATVTKMRESAIRQRVSRGDFDPRNLSQIVKFVNSVKKVDNRN